MDETTWIADGTDEAEPVTTETPAEPESIEAEAVEAVDEPVEEVVQGFIEGRVGDEVFQIPEGLKLPLKHGSDVDYLDIKEVLDNGLRLNDYSRRSNELSTDRQAFERERTDHRSSLAKLEAKEKYLAERDAEIKAALSDPESAAKYEQHLQMYRDNPMYRKVWDQSWTNRETEAELESFKEDRDQRLVREASKTALGWIEELATDFEGVDPGRVASIYGQRLNAGQASLSISDVRSIYQAEQDYLQGASEPLRDQLAELAAKIDLLTDSKAAEKHNEITQHAVARAKTTPVSTGKGAPTTAPVPLTKFGPNQLQERVSDWVKQAG